MTPEEQKWSDRGEQVGTFIFSLIRPICLVLSTICIAIVCLISGKPPPMGKR